MPFRRRWIGPNVSPIGLRHENVLKMRFYVLKISNDRSILEGNLLFTEFKGAFAEQFVCQQLIAECGLTPFYWSAENLRGEIDFVVQKNGITHPIEVKAEENLKSKSLRAFCEKYKGMQARRFSLSGHRDEGWMQNIPLYAIAPFANWK